MSSEENERLAEGLFEWSDVENGRGITPATLDALKPHQNIDDVPYTQVPDYAASWDAAGLVVAELERRGWFVVAMSRVLVLRGTTAELAEAPDVPHWGVQLGKYQALSPSGYDSIVSAQAGTLPAAIAAAALKVLERLEVGQ